MKNFRTAVGSALCVLIGFHFNHGLASVRVNDSWKAVLASVPFILYQAHDAGLVPAGNAGLVFYIFIVQAAGNFQQGAAVLILTKNAI